MSMSSFMGQLYILALVEKSEGMSCLWLQWMALFSFKQKFVGCQLLSNKETFVNSEMLIKMLGYHLSLVITVPHSSVPALICCGEKLQYRHMKT